MFFDPYSFLNTAPPFLVKSGCSSTRFLIAFVDNVKYSSNAFIVTSPSIFKASYANSMTSFALFSYLQESFLLPLPFATAASYHQAEYHSTRHFYQLYEQDNQTKDLLD